MSDDLEGFLGGGAPGLKFPSKGTSYTLTLTDPPYMQQQVDFDTGELLEWPDGNPRKQMVIPGTIPEDEWWDDYDEDNDGEARLFVKSGMRLALRDGLKRAKAKVADLDEGAVLEVTYVKDGPKEGKKQPPKIYKIDVLKTAKKASKGAAEFLDEDDDEEEEAPPKRRRRAASTEEDEAPPKRRRRAAPADEDEDDEDDEAPPARRRTRVTDEVNTAKRNAAKRSAAAAKKRAAEDDEDDEDEAPF